MKNQQDGFAHLAAIGLIIMTFAVVGYGAYGVLQTKNDVDKDNSESSESAEQERPPIAIIEEKPSDSIDSVAVPQPEEQEQVQQPTSEQTEETNDTSTDPVASDPAPQPRYARVSLAYGNYFDVPLNKGGSGDGYFEIQCTKGGPGSEDNRSIITVNTIQGYKRVKICNHHTFTTTNPKSGVARITFSDGQYLDSSTNKGGSMDGYQPTGCKISNENSGIITILTDVDSRRLEICEYHRIPTTTIY